MCYTLCTTLPSLQKSFFCNWIFLESLFSNQWTREFFGKIMSRAFRINHLKYLFLFPNELKLHPKTHQISKKYIEAKYRGCFSQVQQVKLVNKKFEDRSVVFIDTHNKLQEVWKYIHPSRGFTAKQKKPISIGVISRPGWSLPYVLPHKYLFF